MSWLSRLFVSRTTAAASLEQSGPPISVTKADKDVPTPKLSREEQQLPSDSTSSQAKTPKNDEQVVKCRPIPIVQTFSSKKDKRQYTLRLRFRLDVPGGSMKELLFSRDGTRFITLAWPSGKTSLDKASARLHGLEASQVDDSETCPRIWDLDTGGLIRVVSSLPCPPDSIDLMPDDKTLRCVIASHLTEEVLYVDSESGEVTGRVPIERTLPEGASTSIHSFQSPTGPWLVSSDGTRVVQIDQKGMGTFVEAGIIRFVNPANWAVSPDGKHLVTADAEGRLCLWDLVNGVAVKDLYRANPSVGTYKYSPLQFTPDGRFLIAPSLSRRGGTVWSTESWQQVGEGEWQAETLSDCDISPDGSLLAITHYEHSHYLHGVSLLTLPSGESLGSLDHGGEGTCEMSKVRFSPDCKYLATGAHTGNSMAATAPVMVWELVS